MSSPVVHFHVVADDPDRLASFYEEVFGWHPMSARLTAVEGAADRPYRYIDRHDAGISGNVNDRRDYRDVRAGNGGVVLVVEVDDLESTLAAAERLGARRLGDAGPDRLGIWGAGDADDEFELDAFVDPEGNVVELMRR
jgi:predicted enzyme related to lactoylglutathione lyase